jgi:hypothetical protein
VRSYRWLWLWLGCLLLTLFAFLVAIAVAYFLKERGYSLFGNGWMVGAFICLIAAYSCFFAAIKGWGLPSAVKPSFPGVQVEIYGTGSLDIQRESGSGLAVPVTLRSLHARFTNPATNPAAGQAALLEVLLYLRLVPGSWGRVGEAVCPPPDWPLPESLGLTPISMPFDLAQGATVSGHLVYEIPGYYLDKIDQPLNARLELWDHLTDKRMSLPAEIGSYDESRMVPSGGGAEVLGPEYESQPDQPASSG